MIEKLPVLDILPQLTEALDGHGIAVLTAPPGTGKSTALPPELIKLPMVKKLLSSNPEEPPLKPWPPESHGICTKKSAGAWGGASVTKQCRELK